MSSNALRLAASLLALSTLALADAGVARADAGTGRAEAATSSRAAAERRMALTGDFVDLGTGHPAAVRGDAAIRLVNRTSGPVDVNLGRGAGRIEAGKFLLVRIPPGEQPIEVKSPLSPDDVLTGTIHLEAGRAYALGIAWEELRGDAAPRSLETRTGTATEAGSASTSSATKSSATKSDGAEQTKGETKRESKRKTSGRVDVGRKRAKDR